MSIKPKKGKCVDCNLSEPHKYIMAGRCYTGPFFHYQKHKAAKYAENSKKRKAERSLRTLEKGGMTIGQWYNMQISLMTRECENCGTYLSPYNAIGQRSYIAHIVPKRNIESVAVHPLNRMFLCVDCHTNYDNWLNKDIVNMKCWPTAIARFNQFKQNIEIHEYKYLRDCFKEHMKV